MRKVYLSIFILASLSLSACNPPGVSTSTNTNTNPIATVEVVTIEGVVNDPSDIPMTGVKITVRDTSKVIGETTSNSKGEYSVKVPKVFGDSYFIDAKKDISHGTLMQTLLITTGQKGNFIGQNKLNKNEIASNPTPIQ